MKKIVLLSSAMMVTFFSHAQQTQGKVSYERTMQLQFQIEDDHAMIRNLPKTRTDKFELTFGNNKSIWKHIEDMDATDELGNAGPDGNVNVMVVRQSSNDNTFCDFSTNKTVEADDIFGKKYLVTDSIEKLNWKLTGETQTILNHVCQKAIAQKIGKREEMNIDNGEMKRKEVADTANIVAWFTPDIPVSAGPEFPGQLPGLILGLELDNGALVYKATDISDKADLAIIKEPTKGKKVTPEEFKKERDKLMEQMRKNSEGGEGRRVIRVGG